MFKFKMSLLFQNVKFRVAVVVLLITAIILGIVYIPRNKAAEVNNAKLTSNQVISEACKLLGKGYNSKGVGAGHGINFNAWDASVKYDGSKNKLLGINEFSELDCTGFIYYTLTKLGVSTSGFVFQNPVPVDPAHWYCINSTTLVTKNTNNLKYTYKGVTNNIQVLKAGEKVSERPYYLCADGSEIPAGSVVISYGSSLGAKYHDHGWIYIGNLGTTDVKEVAKILVNEYDVDANLLINGDINGDFTIKKFKNTAGNTVDVIQKTDANSTHWRIECTADSNGNGVYINNGDPRVDYQNEGGNKLVGPIYAFKLAEKTFVSGNYTVEVVKVKEDGTTVITSDEATFSINGENKNTTNGVINVATGKNIANTNQKDTYTIKETKAPEGYNAYDGTITLNVGFKKLNGKYVIDTTKTSCTAPGLTGDFFKVSEDNTKITIYVPNTEVENNPEGEYSVELYKVDEDGNIITTPAKFEINGNEATTENGKIEVAKKVKVDSASYVGRYRITEKEAPDGYNLFDGLMVLHVSLKAVDDKYILNEDGITFDYTANDTTKNSKEPTIKIDGSTIKIYVPNTKVEENPEGKYSVELYKVDENGNVITAPAKFEINGKEATTENGKISVAKNVKVEKADYVGKYEIKETEAPENYFLYDGTISLSVKLKEVNKKYVLTQDGITFDYTVNDVTNNTQKPSFKLEGSTIKVYVPNTPKKFDLSLRKFISKIDGKDVTPSRKPIINEQSIKNLQETGTASYYHIKDSIGVTVGSEVEYTIRVYNEGDILGFAKTITDYIPDGLTFVKIADESAKDYTTTAKAGDKAITLTYKGNTVIKSLKDFIGKKVINLTDDYFQEVKVICKVNETDKTYITSRAEITNYGYSEKDSEGNIIWKEAKAIGNVDIDSVQDTIKDDLNLDNWYENAKERTYIDAEGNTVVDKNYFPGVQDDDDFETVEILSGKYNIIIKKVDSSNKVKTLSGAYFTVKGSNINTEVGPTNEVGEISVIKNVQIINDKQVDNYTINETKSPADYHLYNGDIKVKIATKFNGSSFVIDEKNTTVNGKNVEFVLNKNNTTITIIVPNTRKQFDLSLRKFITQVNAKDLDESRVPQVDISKLASGEATTATYTHPKNPVDVNTTDVVTYTIRVYNEGEVDGYANKVMDDIPSGLVFLPENEINKEYKWVMYREMKADEKADSKDIKEYNGKKYVVTNKAEEADYIETEYLADSLIKAFDGKTLDYKDIKVAFKVVEPETSDRILTNYAQITDDRDGNGNEVTDRDSTPNVWNDGEDDQDIDRVKVRYFDLALRKWVTKAIVNEDGKVSVTETKHGPWDNPEPVVKVDLLNTKLDSVVVKFEYSIRIYNQGEIEGYAKEISDYIPEGLKFVQEDNPDWKEVDGKIVTRALENTLLKPGDYADVTVVLTWINGTNNLGKKVNVAEISEDYNDWGTPDIDSTPDNRIPDEDDIDDAPVILTVRTGEPIIYTGIAVAVIAVLSLGIVFIRKRLVK